MTKNKFLLFARSSTGFGRFLLHFAVKTPTAQKLQNCAMEKFCYGQSWPELCVLLGYDLAPPLP